MHHIFLLGWLTLTFTATTAVAAAATTRVVGGTTVQDAFEFPYFAQLANANCGAVLIHDDFLLSAAHCEPKNNPFSKQVFLASTKLDEGLPRTIEYMQAHPGYLPDLQDFDFLLLKLTTSAILDEDTGWPTGVKAIPINADPTVPQPGDPLQAMGFGATREQASSMNPTFQQVQVNYIDNQQCLDEYGPQQFYELLMFCAGVEGGGKDTCQGDSGGPIVDITTGTLVGVVSYGVGCARADYGGVNARVSSVATWIQREICRNSDYPPEYCVEFEDYTPKEQVMDVQPTSASMTLQGQLDDYPEEFACSVTYLGATIQDEDNTNNNTATDTTVFTEPSKEQLLLVMTGSLTKKGQTFQYPFVQLRPGLYDLEFGDNGSNGGDGICCIYGEGSLRLVDGETGDEIWSNQGDYKGYLQVRLEVDELGTIRVAFENKNYLPSYERVPHMNYPPDFDSEWPGPMPDVPRFSFNVNFKFDSYPKENNYEVYYLIGEEVPLEAWETVASMDLWDWEVVDEMIGASDGLHSHLLPRYYVDQSSGWYWLRIEDTSKDGICCRYRRGWVSLTAPIITTMDVGLVWGNNGEFEAGVDVYFYIDTEGVVTHAHWVLADGETGSAGGDNDETSMATERDASEGIIGKGTGGGRVRTRQL